MSKNVVILDFDGTIADVVPLMREIYNDIADERNYPELTDEKFEELRKQNLRQVLWWVGIKPWQYPSVMRKGRTVYKKRRAEVKLFAGATDLIKSLHKDGYVIYILSSNNPVTIRSILKTYDVDRYVAVMARPWLFGKAGSIKALLARKRYDKSKVWMIGDEVRDIHAGNKAGVNSVGVTWGLQHGSVLEKAGPDYLIDKVSDIRKTLDKASSR